MHSFEDFIARKYYINISIFTQFAHIYSNIKLLIRISILNLNFYGTVADNVREHCSRNVQYNIFLIFIHFLRNTLGKTIFK